MPRPLPVLPRGPRRPRVPRPTLLLGCPRVSPDWELAALQALMKPKEQTKGAIRHRPAEQPWPPDAADRAETARRLAAERLGYAPAFQFPAAGDYRLIAEVPAGRLEEAKALAVLLSRHLPGVWFVLDRLFVRDGRFFRRERGFKMNLVEAGNVHLTRAIRSALRGVG